MTREELILYGKDYLHDLETACCKIEEKHKEFVRESIKALEQMSCDDCVSRQAVVQWLENASDDSIEHAINSNLEFIPSATPAQRWISVNEKLPKENGDYFVTVFIGIEIDTNKPVKEVSKDCFSLSDGWSYYGEHVIAWRPLPEPYKAEMVCFEREIEKPFWQTNKKCEYGYFADLTKLPTGTTFDVVNGAWEGKIIKKDNQKHLLCLATGATFPITGNEDLVIDDVCLPS